MVLTTAHRKRVLSFKLAYDIFCQKVTHTGRVRAAEDGIEYGATIEGVKALGLWSQDGSFRKSYDRSLPIDAMLALAYFNGEKKNSYFVAREFLEPPSELLEQIFPWVEEAEAAYQTRLAKLGNTAKDESLVNFLRVLRFFRRVLLQDIAVISYKNPNLKMTILEYAPFNTPCFDAFKERTGFVLQKAEAEFRERRDNLPDMIVQAISGHMQAVYAQQILQQRQLQEFQDSIGAKIMTGMPIRTLSAPSNSKKRKAIDELEVNTASTRSCHHPSFSSAGPEEATWPLDPQDPSADSSPSDCTIVTFPGPFQVPASNSTAQFVSGGGNVYSIDTFPISNIPDVRSLQMKYITKLEAIFPVEKLKHAEFEWVCKKKEWMFLPKFEWWAPAKDVAPSIPDIWREWTIGIGHRFSIQELVQEWQALWKRDKNAIKSQWTRRYKLITLIEDLIKQNKGWSPDDAMEFLNTDYPLSPENKDPHFRSSRSFADWMKGDKERDGVLNASISFVPSQRGSPT
ncbi:hypothetical protein NMY22_g19973 [Coprinellus aureogranulatus]|nr:hypothetical protein NMY22_g19973 [Coprinellus aureogranulatus]